MGGDGLLVAELPGSYQHLCLLIKYANRALRGNTNIGHGGGHQGTAGSSILCFLFQQLVISSTHLSSLYHDL